VRCKSTRRWISAEGLGGRDKRLSRCLAPFRQRAASQNGQGRSCPRSRHCVAVFLELCTPCQETAVKHEQSTRSREKGVSPSDSVNRHNLPSCYRRWLECVGLFSLAHTVSAITRGAFIGVRSRSMPTTGNNLTAGAARLAVALFKGQSVEDYAKEAAIRINTARWYVKQVYAKTGVNRQAELVQLLLKSAAHIKEFPHED
jgi:DNA-binding CsgD family transcriptional regulator